MYNAVFFIKNYLNDHKGSEKELKDLLEKEGKNFIKSDNIFDQFS